MTNLLDIRTVLISYVVSSAICLAVVAPIWRNNHRRTPEIGFWLADYILQFVALLLIALRGVAPDFLSMVVSHTFVIGGTILLYIGIERFADRRTNQLHNWVMLAVFAAVQTYFAVVDPSLVARNVNLSAGLLFICAQAAWLMLRRVGPGMRRATRGAGIVMAIYSALSLVRIFVDLAGPRVEDMFRSQLFDTTVVLSYQMLFIALTFGLLLMVNRRLITVLEGDIVEREHAEARLRELSDRDPLTGLLNSRAFHVEARDRLEEIGRQHASLVYLDLDGLKEFNDGYGHPSGDAALVALAEALKSAFRGSDVIGRLGGDEFAVLAISREAGSEDAIVARLTAELARVNAEGALPFDVSTSLGVASWDESDGAPDLQALIKSADQRMYEQKRRHHAQRA